MTHIIHQPNPIVTNYLAIGQVTYSSDTNDDILLHCLYGDLEQQNYSHVSVETDFDVLNQLIMVAGQEPSQEEAIDAFLEALSNPSEEKTQQIELYQHCAINLHQFIFSLIPIMETDEDGLPFFPEGDDLRYRLAHFVPVNGTLPDFEEMGLKVEESKSSYYNEVLLVRYALYLSLRKQMTEDDARSYSRLFDELTFSMAKLEAERAGISEGDGL